jgi:thymidylate kinase
MSSGSRSPPLSTRESNSAPVPPPAAQVTSSFPADPSYSPVPSPPVERDRCRLAFSGLALPRFAARPSSGPRVVAVEGPNGAGKSTLCRSLGAALGVPARLGTDPAWFAEPFKTRMIRDSEWFVSAMFFLSGCLEQMRLLRGAPDGMVLLDRSMWSTLAVHAAHSAERLEVVLAMLRPVADQVPVPDLTLVLEASFDTCQSRIARKTPADQALDALTARETFHTCEREFYRWLARQVPGVLFLDADLASEQELAEQARELIRARTEC